MKKTKTFKEEELFEALKGVLRVDLIEKSLRRQSVKKKSVKKKSFKDHADGGLEEFDYLECAIGSKNWGMLDRSLRRNDVPISYEARILLADLLKSLPLPQPRGRKPIPPGKQSPETDKWRASNAMMKTARETLDLDEAAEVVRVQLANLGWIATVEQIKDEWRRRRYGYPR